MRLNRNTKNDRETKAKKSYQIKSIKIKVSVVKSFFLTKNTSIKANFHIYRCNTKTNVP